MKAPSALPAAVQAAHDGWSPELVYGPYMYATWRLTSPAGEVRFVKLAHRGAYPSLQAERDRMVWARRHLPVPVVVDHGVEDDVEWLETIALPGVDATRVDDDPAVIVRALGEGLRRFHDAPTEDCPFVFTLDRAIEHCMGRVRSPDRTRPRKEDFGDLSPEAALGELIRTRPASEDVVVCHGDYCFPNMLLEDGHVTGYVDLGELGLADRWWDIAVGAWSVTWNVDPALEPLFYEAYGVDPDPARIRFYRLMYDLAS